MYYHTLSAVGLLERVDRGLNKRKIQMSLSSALNEAIILSQRAAKELENGDDVLLIIQGNKPMSMP